MLSKRSFDLSHVKYKDGIHDAAHSQEELNAKHQLTRVYEAPFCSCPHCTLCIGFALCCHRGVAVSIPQTAELKANIAGSSPTNVIPAQEHTG